MEKYSMLEEMKHFAEVFQIIFVVLAVVSLASFFFVVAYGRINRGRYLDEPLEFGVDPVLVSSTFLCLTIFSIGVYNTTEKIESIEIKQESIVDFENSKIVIKVEPDGL